MLACHPRVAGSRLLNFLRGSDKKTRGPQRTLYLWGPLVSLALQSLSVGIAQLLTLLFPSGYLEEGYRLDGATQRIPYQECRPVLPSLCKCL